MGRGQEVGPKARKFAAADALPRGRAVFVRSKDGIRLHAEVFGPEDGYPIVLAHGITCAIRVWAYQIADLANDYRVIAYDHRGHGRSAVPVRRRAYSLDHLAGDLDSVLEATLAPGTSTEVWWSMRDSTPVAAAKDARLLADVMTLVTLGDSDVRMVGLIDLTMDHSSAIAFSFDADDCSIMLSAATAAALI